MTRLRARSASQQVLFVQKSWDSPSELWLSRMRRMLDPHIFAMAAEAPPCHHQANGVPVIGLNIDRQRRRRPEWWQHSIRQRRILSALELDVAQLREAATHPNVKSVLIHYANWALRYRSAWKDLAKPVFVHVHGYDIAFDGYSDNYPNQRLFSDEYAAQLADFARDVHFIANSRNSRTKLLQAGVSPERVLLKPLGVPVTCQARQTLSSHPTFLYLGRLVEWKGPHLTIEAYNQYRQMGGRGSLIIAGDGPMREHCETLISESPYGDSIRLLGYVSEERGNQLRQQADAFIAHNCKGPSTLREEALGVAPLEAMASGLPVISGRSGGLIETVVDGHTGYLVRPGDTTAQAEAMLQLVADPAKWAEMSSNSIEHIRQSFSLEREQRQLFQILGL